LSFDPLTLPWLPEPGETWRQQAKALADDPAPGAALQRLAGYGLDSAQSRLLSRQVTRAISSGRSLAPLSSLRLTVLSSTTFDFIADALPAACARHGVAVELYVAPLDTIEAEAINPTSAAYQHHADATLVLVDHRWLGLASPALERDPAAAIEAAMKRLGGVARALKANGAQTLILPTIAVPPQGLFGSLDRMVAGSVRAQVTAFNARLPELVREVGALLLDVAALAEEVGTARWFHAPAYNLYKLPFHSAAAPLFVDWLGRLLGSLRGKARKCLVLDLDNTCWGGVIGDDGLEGICIGPGSPEGESFHAVQQSALELKARGVILAISSKNDDANARAPFREHPDMALREKDIAVFQANWNDKATNLEAIAKTLSIGLDALVLLDDNPIERAQVRAALPMVAVPELPSDAAHYPSLLRAAGYFEAISFTDEDRTRAASYIANAQRVAVEAGAHNYGDYLAALEMNIHHAPFDAIGRARIAQLINKSNQFNLTTRRYSESEVSAMASDPSVFTLQTRLQDRFSSFGMIGVVIARPQDTGAWGIDTWLMSCRVLGRRVEEAMLDRLVKSARTAGIAMVHAEYVPTEKNGMVSEHFDKLGFTRLSEGADGVRRYELVVADYVSPELPFATEETEELAGKQK
jgi:FkbH-like protein